MKEINECNLIHDLLPMYIEELVNEDTKEFVEKHVSSCHRCQERLEDMKSNMIEEINTKENITNEERNLDIEFINIMKKIRRRNRLMILTSVILVSIFFLIFIFLKNNNYIK